MRKNAVLFLLLLTCSMAASAQDRMDVFNAGTPIIWLGVDFTKAKFIGDRERLGSQSDVLHLMESINQLILNESSKFNIARAIGRGRVESDISVTSDHNVNLEINEMFSEQTSDFQRLRQSDIGEIISTYNFAGRKGIGMMFNVESFSKPDLAASVWVTFVDMDSRVVLFTQKLTGKPKGFGLRNYWSGALYEIIENIRKKEFEMWKRRTS